MVACEQSARTEDDAAANDTKRTAADAHQISAALASIAILLNSGVRHSYVSVATAIAATDLKATKRRGWHGAITTERSAVDVNAARTNADSATIKVHDISHIKLQRAAEGLYPDGRALEIRAVESAVVQARTAAQELKAPREVQAV